MRGSETITFATFSLKRSCEAIFYDYKQNNAILKIKVFAKFDGLWTPNEGINQRNLKIWADVQTKYASAVPKNLGVGVNFRPCSEGYFLSGRP